MTSRSRLNAVEARRGNLLNRTDSPNSTVPDAPTPRRAPRSYRPRRPAIARLALTPRLDCVVTSLMGGDGSQRQTNRHSESVTREVSRNEAEWVQPSVPLNSSHVTWGA